MRSALDGSCQSGELCLYYNSDHKGSLADFELGVKDFASVQFVSAGAGTGVKVKNNAASACNKDDNLTARVHYNSNWQGAYDSKDEAPYFLTVGGVAVVFGVLLAFASPMIRRLMRGVR